MTQTKLKLKARLLLRFFLPLLSIIFKPMRLRSIGFERFLEMEKEGNGGLLLMWHGSIQLPLHFLNNRGLYAMVSASQPGELLTRILSKYGYNTMRGSSNRHSLRVLLEASRTIENGKIVVITPDGPRGPYKKVHHGSVYLAKKTGCPVIALGVASKPSVRVNSWDRHLVPFFFSKAVISFSDIVYINPDEPDEIAARRISELIDTAEKNAEELLKQG